MNTKHIDFKIYGVKGINNVEDVLMEMNECEFCNTGDLQFVLQEVSIENDVGIGFLNVIYKDNINLKEKLSEIVCCEFCVDNIELYLNGVLFKSEAKTKTFNVTYQYAMIGTASIQVPSHLTLEEAIEYAKERMDDIPMPRNAEYLTGSEIIDEENCDFDAL